MVLKPSFFNNLPHKSTIRRIFLKCRKNLLDLLKECPLDWNFFVMMDEVLDPLYSLEDNLVAKSFLKNDDNAKKLVDYITTCKGKIEDILFTNEKLYKEIKNLNISTYSTSQRAVINKYLNTFKMNGIHLSEAKRKRLTEIEYALNSAIDKYSNLVLKIELNSFIDLPKHIDLDGLTDEEIDRAKKDSRNAGKNGYRLSVKERNRINILKTSSNRYLRELVWRHPFDLARTAKYNPEPIVKEILDLRQKKAKILGFNNAGEMLTKDNSLNTPQKTLSFLKKIGATLSKKHKIKEKKLLNFAKELGITKVEPWDLSYLEELQGKQDLKWDYGWDFNLVLKGIFALWKKYLNVEVKREWVSKNMSAYKVSRFNKILGYLYIDPWARKYKDEMSWNSTISSCRANQPKHILISFDFNKSLKKYLDWDSVIVMFHELGHSIHGLVTNYEISSFNGINCQNDLVEVPSQLFENFAYSSEGFSLISPDLTKKEQQDLLTIHQQKRTNTFSLFSDLRNSVSDVAVHYKKVSGPLASFEAGLFKKFNFSKMYSYSGESIIKFFPHIFIIGYEGNYYGYLYSNVVESNLWEYLSENPMEWNNFIFDLLSKSNTTNFLDKIEKFIGHKINGKNFLSRFK